MDINQGFLLPAPHPAFFPADKNSIVQIVKDLTAAADYPPNVLSRRFVTGLRNGIVFAALLWAILGAGLYLLIR